MYASQSISVSEPSVNADLERKRNTYQRGDIHGTFSIMKAHKHASAASNSGEIHWVCLVS